ncbi:MAG: xanthine phosphoribosyltransferase [Clostridia bacterium]|nr:xanthine phosphoribosyltransferase [Clostridia bacterium]
MKAMEEKILSDGKILPGQILKVGGFLNQQTDIKFMVEAAKEVARLYEGTKITKVLTIEASGISFSTLVAEQLGVDLVVIKKHASANISGDVYTAEIYSYTHKNSYVATVSKDYINEGDKILFCDDFLACGNAIKGVQKILTTAGAELVGCAIAIEKGFQHGGDTLRSEGIRVESLAIVESMTDDAIVFRK